jgi:carboxyl-terminal processing protease
MKHFLLLVLFITIHNSGRSQPSHCAEAFLILEKIQQQHVSPRASDTEDFRKQVLLNFAREIDPQTLYFSQTEIAKITSFPLHVARPKNNVCEIISETRLLIQNQLNEYKDFATSLLSKPLNFTTKEFFTYNINPDHNIFEEKIRLPRKWNQWLKFQVLMRMHHEARLSGKESFLNFEKRAREKVLAHVMKEISQLINPPGGIEQNLTTHFMKALATAFDPHTEFFSKDEMKEFQSSLSTKAFSWGFELSENKMGQFVINKIVPGGPAWNSNAIHKNDIVVEFNFENGTILEAMDFSLYELNSVLKDISKTKVEVTIQRMDGKLETVRLEKSEIGSEENIVRSFVLKGGEKKIGYISLPAFYTDWSDPSSKGCANDVAKELIKLKKENINGVILDLRFNGGGLVEEAVDLAGIFIDFGPLMIFKTKEEAPIILKDLNRGIAYDGPLLILINGLSASASELVAAAMQDHRRAIIAGSTSFGKSTGQMVFPLVGNDTLGFVKVTLDKIYRITGKTHQLQGVKPDILMPDFTDLYGYSERNYLSSLPSDSILKKVYYSPLAVIPLSELRTRSEKRIASSASFQKISRERNEFSSQIPLELNEFFNYMQNEEKRSEEHKNQFKSFEVVVSQFDRRMLDVDSYTKEINYQLLNEIATSPYVEESFNILTDYIKLKSK